MAVVGNEEHKQRVNLSSLAYGVVEMDRGVFDEGGSLSGFLNRIITAFYPNADASIDVAVAERRQQLITGGYSTETVEQMTGEYRSQLCAKKEAYPQGDSITFRLNNLNFHLLYENRAEEENYGAPSKYLKALLEEYARLSPSERERIYYAQMIGETLQPAVDAGFMLELKMAGKAFWFKPYSLMADPFNSHLYLVGLSRRVDRDSTREVVASFRITRLSGAKIRRQPSGRLTADQRRQIEKKLQEVGVQYLVGTQDRITVRLTEVGKQQFLQRSYMRPTPEKMEGNLVHFCCSRMQVRNYFLPFGKEAEIIAPEILRQDFARIYEEAAQLYK